MADQSVFAIGGGWGGKRRLRPGMPRRITYLSALVMETLFAWEPIGAGSVASCDGDEIPEWYKGDEDWSIGNEPRVGKIDTPERGLRLLAFGIRHSARCKITPGVCYPQNPTPNEHLCN